MDFDIKILKKNAKLSRLYMLKYAKNEQSYHFGGSFSCVEILTYIYNVIINGDLKEHHRDRFVLSKGHAAYALYSTLAIRGDIKVQELSTYKEFGSRLQGHPDMRRLDIIDFSTASLGQGLSIGTGYAISNLIRCNEYNTFVLMGDGEMQEGQVWEAAMCAAKYKLNNLYCIVDYNKYQVDGLVQNVMPLEPIGAKWEAFGWSVFNIEDGHDFCQINEIFREAMDRKGGPKVIIANTTKGKGVSFMENSRDWHSNSLRDEALRLYAIRRIEGEKNI